MPKFIITWNAGYGESAEVIEAETQDEAREEAYRMWREEAEAQADYNAEPYTKARAYELGAENDDEDEE